MENEYLGLYEFKMLSDLEQLAYVWSRATCIGTMIKADFKINLYTVGDFCVEVFYDPVENSVSHLRTFKNQDLLIPYIMASGISLN